MPGFDLLTLRVITVSYPVTAPDGIRKGYTDSLGHGTLSHLKSFCGILNKICTHEAKIYTTNKYG
jgi:hypothetical protein